MQGTPGESLQTTAQDRDEELELAGVVQLLAVDDVLRSVGDAARPSGVIRVYTSQGASDAASAAAGGGGGGGRRGGRQEEGRIGKRNRTTTLAGRKTAAVTRTTLRPSKREPAKITRSRNGSGAGACEREACGSQRRGRLTRGQPSQEARAAPQQGPHVPTAL